jgi:hypothetical protein
MKKSAMVCGFGPSESGTFSIFIDQVAGIQSETDEDGLTISGDAEMWDAIFELYQAMKA